MIRKTGNANVLEDNVSFNDDDEPNAKLVLMPALPKDVHSDILKAVNNIKFTKLEMKLVDDHNANGKFAFYIYIYKTLLY